VRKAAERVLGKENVVVDVAPLMASEDFAFMLEQKPGSYFFLGHDGLTCHHPEFDFDDDTLTVGAAARPALGRLEQAVDGLDTAIGLASLRSRDNSVEMLANHARDFFHGSTTTVGN
jgi:hypothetical protein